MVNMTHVKTFCWISIGIILIIFGTAFLSYLSHSSNPDLSKFKEAIKNASLIVGGLVVYHAIVKHVD